VDEPDLSAILSAMTDHMAALRASLERYEPAFLSVRPPNGNWSAIENIRHILFAEQVHLARFVPGGLGLSPMGLAQGAMQGRKPIEIVGTEPTTDLATAFGEWARIHALACSRIDLCRPELPDRLPRLLRHQKTHGAMALRAARQLTVPSLAAAPRPASKARAKT
jgi:hypothetical protein